MRVLAVSSQVAYGPVGLTASVPALQARGHEVLAVPTVTLSNHPGHGAPAGFRSNAADLSAIFTALENLGVLRGCAGVMTGYFASADQVQVVAGVVSRMKAANPALYVLIDPVIGDDGALYVPLAVAEAIRDQLLPLATCTTPNRFELEWLSGLRDILPAARSLGPREVLATSIPKDGGQLATLLITADHCSEWFSTHKQSVPRGTGDFLAGLYLGERLRLDMAPAFRAAMTVLERAIARSAGSTVLEISHEP